MNELQNKYASVILAAKNAGINNLQIQEQDGILYISGNAANSTAKDAVWNALGIIDPNFSASDINLDVQILGLDPGTNLTIVTEQTSLNIRENPSTESRVLSKVEKGEQVTLVEQTNSEWWLVKTKNGTQGYAYSRYLKL